MHRLCLTLILFFGTFMPAAYAQDANRGHLPHPDYDAVYGYGIDLSHYNSEPDWNQLEVDFVIMKATQGTSYLDPTFNKRREKCRAAGIPVGAYHYFTGKSSGRNEFDNYFRNVGMDIEIIPVVDVEKIPQGVKREAYLENLRDFILAAAEAYGTMPIIYTHQEFLDNCVSEMIETNWGEYPGHLWLGDLDVDYSWFPGYPSIHQSTIKNVKGIKGKVDFDELHRPLEELLLRKF